MPLEGAVTAEGKLERTPIAHLLVYAADRRLSGAMVFSEPDGAEHVVQFLRGSAVKVRPGDAYALFGELLVADGLVSREIVDAALATRGLIGDVLLLSGCVDAVTLEWVAEVQFVKRMVRLFSLPAETHYRYFEGQSVLEEWGGEPATVGPLALLWAGLREYGARSAQRAMMLDRVSSMPLRMHPALDPGRFGFGGREMEVLRQLRDEPLTLDELLATRVAHPETIRNVIYTLLITRYIDLGTGALPLGVTSSMPPVSSSSQRLGRLHLRPTLHRLGAAAPDPSGDGERAPMSSRTRGRDRRSDPEIDDEPSGVSGPPSSSLRSLQPLSEGRVSPASKR
ncbi:hypothetical protein [Chondromyces crocatus]|uniref:DUF4388 domain-containing protein n=1 Tax=Chondromyces crocatus TaxID=52 RepID=A0A0K1ENU8_CHOCO|nr:hypothetical protein [Chondromyces crocatus]AKT42293.1 uncharacterized protein CMC5_065160 [Chondromyces crocatus]